MRTGGLKLWIATLACSIVLSGGSHAFAGKRHHSHGSWGSHGSHGSHGSWGSSGSSGGWGSSGSSGGAQPAAPEPPPAETRGVAPARLVMNVPENATIYCMGKKTVTTGTTRRFVIPLAQSGQEFRYPIKVEIVRNGKTYVAESVAKVRSGKTVELTVAESAEGEMLALVQK